MVTGSSFASAYLVERFDCPYCPWRGQIVVDTVEAAVQTAVQADPDKLQRLRDEERRGALSEHERMQMNALDRADHLQNAHGSVEAGLNRQAAGAAPRATSRKARWLADSARCPGCERRHEARVRMWHGDEVGRALGILVPVLIGSVVLVMIGAPVVGIANPGITAYVLAGGLAVIAWALFVATSVRNRWNAPTDDVRFLPDKA